MNREILFRAKRKDWKNLPEEKWWVKGLLTVKCTMLCIQDSYDENLYYSIIPDTLCQYTGFTDNNSNKIWENDIITIFIYSYDVPENDYTGIVVYSKSKACWCLKDLNDNEKIVPIHELYGSYITQIFYTGNIFDDPELLEVKE